jgi:hypothetical protein
MFLSVLSFIGSAFMVLAAVFMIFAGAMMPKTPGNPVSPAILGVIYIPLALLYIYPGIKLWGYGSAIKSLLASRATHDLEAALGQQKSFWKFAGIAAIVMIVLYVLMVVGMVIAAMVTAGTR